MVQLSADFAVPERPARRWTLAVFALIRIQQTFLFVQKTDSVAWTFPGGRVKRGESIPDALRREVREETGLEILAGDIAATLERADQRQLCVYFHAVPRDWPARGLRPTTAEISKVQKFPVNLPPQPLLPQAALVLAHLRPPFRGSAWIPGTRLKAAAEDAPRSG